MKWIIALLVFSSLAWGAESPKEAPTAQVTEGVPTVSIGHVNFITRVYLSPDEKKAVAYDGSHVRAWDVESGREISLLAQFSADYARGAALTLRFVPELDWLVVGTSTIKIYRASTLAPLEEWPIRAHAIVWPQGAKRGFWANTSRDQLEIGELVAGPAEGRGPKVRIVVKSDTIGAKPLITSLLEMQDGRLLAATNYGAFMVDPKTWAISSPNNRLAHATAGETSANRSGAVATTTFSGEHVEHFITPGPNGTFLQLEYSKNYPVKTKLAVLSGDDLSVLRQTEFEGGGSPLPMETWNPKEKKLWLSYYNRLAPVDFETLAIGQPVIPESVFAVEQNAQLRTATAGADKNRWLVAANRVLCWYDLPTNKVVKIFGDRVPAFARIVAHPTEFEFLVTDRYTTAKRVRFTPSGLQVTGAKGQYSAFAYDPVDAQTIAHGSLYTPIIQLSETNQWPKEDFRLPLKPESDTAGAAAHLVYSGDGSLLAEHSPYGVTVFDVQSGKRVLNETLSKAASNYTAQITAISPDNKWLVAYDGVDGGKLVGYDLLNRKKAWEQKVKHNGSLVYFVGAKTFCTLTLGNLEYRSAEDGTIKVSAVVPGALAPSSTAVRPDRKRLAYGSYKLFIFDTENEKVVFEAPITSRIQSMAYLANPRFLITAGADNLLRLWDLDEQRELCSIALFANDDDWVVSTSNLRFDGSEGGLGKMYIVRQGAVLSLESLFEKLYSPKLLTSLLSGEKLAPPTVDLNKLHAAPTLKLELADAARNLHVENDGPDHQTDREAVRLRVVADAGDVNLEELRLYQNGKLITAKQLTTPKLSEALDLQLVPGSNVFKAIAVNSERTESRAQEISIDYRPAKAAGAAPTGLRLHLLVVGVNAYRNPKYNLNYAVADATAVKQQIEKQTQSIFTGVNAKFIQDTQADKATILSAFKAISSAAGPRDVFVFYYAGHGVMTSGPKPEFYLVPHDVVQLYGADDALREKGISAAELQELAKAMPAQKQLFLLDACQSAGALTTVAMRGAAEEKAIAQLARSTGTHWLTASGSEQFATEFEQLGHGAFTYVLLDALNGKADTGDGRVTVNELKAYLEAQVPEVTQKYKGTPQFPSSYGFGQDFPVAVVK